MKKILVLIFLIYISTICFGQYDKKYVSVSNVNIGTDNFVVTKMMLNGGRVKVKYFAVKDVLHKKSVHQRFLEWAINKRIILYTSGTYMTDCDGSKALPVGLCIDQGNLVNSLVKTDLGALLTVSPLGDINVYKWKDAIFSPKISSGTDNNKVVDLNNPLDKAQFLRVAKELELTVFQSHLLGFQDKIEVYENSSLKKQERRFLCICQDENGINVHYVINLVNFLTLREATEKVLNFLKQYEDLPKVVAIVNLDPGCQNVFQLYDHLGNAVQRPGHYGNVRIENAANLMVYYYE